VFTLFIGFLISGATAHPREFYTKSIGWGGAFICIEGRAIAGLVGTVLQFIIFLVDYCHEDIISRPLGNNPNSIKVAKDVHREARKGLDFMESMSWVTDGCRYISWICLAEFYLSFTLGMYAFNENEKEIGNHDSLALYIFVATATAVAVATLWLTNYIIKRQHHCDICAQGIDGGSQHGRAQRGGGSFI